VRDVITSFLTFTLQSEWTLFEETRVANTGLVLCSSSRFDNDIDRLGRRQPDWILVSKTKQKDSYCRLGSPLRHTPGPIASGSHTKAAGISTSDRRPELLHRVRMVGACLPVDSGNSGNDRLFPRRMHAEVFRYPTEALACCNRKDSACFRPGIPLSPQGALWGTS
jgi:hypothetical protein